MKDRQRHARVFNTAPASTKDRLKTARPRADLLKGKKDWYRIENLAGAGTASIYIYDEIGYWGITATDFIRDLNGVTASRIDLHLNSPGGEAFEGIAIYSALKQHAAEVHVYVDSLAASIASVIAMSGDTITMGTGSTMMIHLASGLEIGNADDLRRYADVLDVVSGNAASIYAERAGGTDEQWLEAMRVETWYTAEEAVAAGLADEVTAARERDVVVPQNSWDLSIYTYAGREKAPPPLVRQPVNLALENNEADTAAVVVPAVSTVHQDGAVTVDGAEPDAVVEPVPAADVEPVAEAPVAEVVPVVEPAPVADATPAAADVIPEPEPDPAPADDAPVADDWDAMTAGLLTPAPSEADAVFHALTKGLLR